MMLDYEAAGCPTLPGSTTLTERGVQMGSPDDLDIDDATWLLGWFSIFPWLLAWSTFFALVNSNFPFHATITRIGKNPFANLVFLQCSK